MSTCIWTGTSSSVFATAGNWLGGSAPVNSDTVYIAGSVSITGAATGLSGIVLIVDPTYTGSIGSSSTYLGFSTCASFNHAGTGTNYIDLGTSNITANVTATGPGNSLLNTSGLYLKGSNLATLNVSGGYVGLATGVDAETSTAATVRVTGSSTYVVLSSGVTLTTASVTSGSLDMSCAATTVTVNSGMVTTRGSGAITTMTQYAGTLFPYSSGTITTLNLNGGVASFIGNPVARTATTIKYNPGATLVYDPALLTITNKITPDFPCRVSVTAA